LSAAAQRLTDTASKMTEYEQQVWSLLNEHWARKKGSRELPKWASNSLERGSRFAGKLAEGVTEAVPTAIKEPTRRAGDAAADKAFVPIAAAAARLLELFNAWALELNDPMMVEKLARKRGLRIDSFAELRLQELKVCDRLLTRHTLTWRTAGALEGGAMGVLALVPVAGIPLAIGADVIVIQVLSVSIAARIAHSYGYDAKDPNEQLFIQQLVGRSFMVQAAKAEPMRKAALSAQAIKGRIRWSEKLRTDHRLLAALEKLMQQLGPNGAKVSVQSVAKVAPFVGILIGAGVNSAILGNVALDAQRYCQTRFLYEKYELPLPAALIADLGENSEDESV